MERAELLSKYKENFSLYERASKNTKEAIEQFLKENEIQYLIVSARVKKLIEKNILNLLKKMRIFVEFELFCII